LPDEQTPDQPDSGAHPNQSGVTESGYSYSVVDDAADGGAAPLDEPRKPRRSAGGINPLMLAAIAIVPALIVGVIVWFVVSAMDDGGGGDARVERNVANVVNAFSQTGDGSGVIRYEGEVPPSFPDDMPTYPGGNVISSIVQLRGDDAGYIIVFDTDDGRQDVANYFSEALTEDPWQVEIEQTGRESTVLQFSNIEDPNIEGVVLAAESKGDETTTIFMSLNVVGGGVDLEPEPFDEATGRPLPAGFPTEQVPTYPEATIIETGYQRSPQGSQFLAAMVSEDEASDVMTYYRDHFESQGWTVEDAPDGSSELAGGVALSFTSDDGETTGVVEAGEFVEDENLTRVNVQVAAPN
jgi:hypothetical protein